MRLTNNRIRSSSKIVASFLLGLGNGFFGCTPNCEFDGTEIIVDESAMPTVPDQVTGGGCFNYSVARTHQTDRELELILLAEKLSSTVGPDWFSVTKSSHASVPFLIPDAVTTEAISYYAVRIRSIQRGEIESPHNGVSFGYQARVVYPDAMPENGVGGITTVRLDLGYAESYGSLAAYSMNAYREIDFNQNGDVIEVRGDGKAANGSIASAIRSDP